MRETYNTIKIILEAIQYENHKWRISCVLKVVAILCGLQTGYTRHMCFICKWNTRFKGDQYKEHGWEVRDQYTPGRENVLNPPLVNVNKVLLPHLHIKLGIVKNIVKSLDR